MKFLAIALLICSFYPSETSFKEARLRAERESKPLLLVFSGSDWCRPCIQFQSNVLGTDAFTAYADASLVVFIADLPRNEDLLPEAQLQENRELAALYNPQGYFPQLVLFKNGAIVKTKSGAFASFDELKTWLESN